jgi:tRNA (cmo5U34)-methyltransferase
VSTSLGHMPGDKWAFDSEVTQCFQDMLARSIPQLETMRQLVTALGLHFVHAGDHILDLGCSLGDALIPFVRHYGAHCRYTGIELSAPMAAAAQQRFASWQSSDAYGASMPVTVMIRQADIRREYPQEMHALTLAILTLMFVPIEHRQQVVRRMYQQTQPGGAVLIVEKILGATAELDTLWVEEYLALKRQQGYTTEEIERKRLALEGVLVPMTARWNEDMLRQAGFTQVECFWRYLNFAGWLAIKG